MKPLVSIIVLTFNSQDYIGRALKSLRQQFYPNIEVLVVDNGSTDGTQQVVESFGGVVWLSLPCSDMGMARNYGVNHSRGEYLMFLDSDDFYLENKVDSQVSVMEARPALGALFGTAYIYRDGQRNLLGIKSNTHNSLSLIDFMSGFCYTLATICIRRSFWNSDISFDEGELGRYGEDWRFQLNLAYKNVPFDVLDNQAVVVEIREGSHTSWDIQPKMKQLALNTVENLLASSGEIRFESNIAQKILDSYRFKLTVSLALVGRRKEAFIVQRKIKTLSKSLTAKTLLWSAAVLPAAWIRALLESIWTRRQHNTFQWSRPTESIAMQIATLTS